MNQETFDREVLAATEPPSLLAKFDIVFAIATSILRKMPLEDRKTSMQKMLTVIDNMVDRALARGEE